MADRPPPGQVTCPLCDQVCRIPAEGSDSLPNNLHALHIVELNKKMNDQNKMLTQRDRSLAERDSTIVGHENTITALSSTNTKLNNILKNGQ